jgi:hypothetical protein
MKEYIEIENGIEYNVVEFEQTDLDDNPTFFDKLIGKNVFFKQNKNNFVAYGKDGKYHNEYGQSIHGEYEGIKGGLYHIEGNALSEEEFTNYDRDKKLKDILS